MKIDIDTSELSDLAQTLLEAAPKQAKSKARKVTTAEARQVKARWRAAVPKDRPWLQGAIHTKAWNNPDSVATSIFAETLDPEGRPVAFVVEYGTSKMAPQPSAEPALLASEATYPAAILAAIDPFGSDTGGSGGGDE